MHGEGSKYLAGTDEGKLMNKYADDFVKDSTKGDWFTAKNYNANKAPAATPRWAPAS